MRVEEALYLDSLDSIQNLDAACRGRLVQDIEISAKCFRAIALITWLDLLQSFPKLETITISDDYLSDAEKAEIEDVLRLEIPDVQLTWSYDLCLDGRHGR